MSVLLRQPHGFEGLALGPVVLRTPKSFPSRHRADMPDRSTRLGAAARAVPANAHRSTAHSSEVDELATARRGSREGASSGLPPAAHDAVVTVIAALARAKRGTDRHVSVGSSAHEWHQARRSLNASIARRSRAPRSPATSPTPRGQRLRGLRRHSEKFSSRITLPCWSSVHRKETCPRAQRRFPDPENQLHERHQAIIAEVDQLLRLELEAIAPGGKPVAVELLVTLAPAIDRLDVAKPENSGLTWISTSGWYLGSTASKSRRFTAPKPRFTDARSAPAEGETSPADDCESTDCSEEPRKAQHQALFERTRGAMCGRERLADDVLLRHRPRSIPQAQESA